MLRSIRNNVKGTAAKIILAILIIPFVFFGVGSLVDSSGGNILLEVNGEEVDQGELLFEMQLVRNQMIANMGEDIDYEQLSQEKLMPFALDRMTDQILLRQASADMKMSVPEILIDTIITSNPSFQQDGQFSNAQLSAFLNNQGLSLAMLKQRVANDVQQSQLSAGLASSYFNLPFNDDILIGILTETRELNWLKLAMADVLSGIKPSDEDINAFYQENMSIYQTERSLIAEYLDIQLQELFQPVSEESLLKEYSLQKAQFVEEESREVAHILLEINADQDEVQASDKLNVVQQRLDEGESFADLAREFSQDAGSAEAGGYLGYIQQGAGFPEDFERVSFSLLEGEVSNPVKTEAGMHLIQLLAIELETFPPFEDLRDAITEQIQIRDARVQYVNLLEQAADLSFNAADLQAPADELNLTVKTSMPVTKSGLMADVEDGNSIFDNQSVIDALYSDEVLLDSVNSELIEISDDRSIIVRVKEVFEPKQLAISEVSSDIAQRLTVQQAAKALSVQESNIRESLDLGLSFSDAAKKQGATLSTGFFSRNSKVLEQDLVSQIFSIPRNELGIQSFAASNGDIYLFELLSVDQDDEQMNPALLASLKQQLLTMGGQQDVAYYMQSLKHSAEIKR
ncbi:MAG: SurA N-terminal domain-containing protein [Pseudomonadota bacterium]|nr:SurA N-terminal domain-containing protein [Pseudomonadota bacterium]